MHRQDYTPLRKPLHSVPLAVVELVVLAGAVSQVHSFALDPVTVVRHTDAGQGIGVDSGSGVPISADSVAATAPRTVTEFAKITPSDGYPISFGASISVSGDDLVVGAPAFFTEEGMVGTAYVFHRVGPRWVETGKLFVSFGAIEGEGLGWSVAIEGDYIVVGAPQFIGAPAVGGGYGRVFIFRRDDRGTPDDPFDDQWWRWSELRTPDEIRWGDNYGASVDISDGVVLIGKPGGSLITGASGSAYLYRNVNGHWRHVGSLYPSDSHFGDQFGDAVSLSGPVALIGASRHIEGGIISGAAYVFRETISGWSQEAKLLPNAEPGRGLFGTRVSVASDQAVVGGSADLDPWPAAGTAYVYMAGESPWSNQTKLRGTETYDMETFGRAVAIAANSIVVGAPGQNSHFGAAYIFQRDASRWVEKCKLIASHRPSTAVLGASVAVNEKYAFAGAQEAVFVYVLPSAAKSLRDYSDFQSCFRGEERELVAECAKFDLAPDGRIDLRDFNELLATLAGP